MLPGHARAMARLKIEQVLLDAEFPEPVYTLPGVNCFWVIDNSQQVLSTLNKINYFSTAKHLDGYDFATLYTSIRHDSLKQALKSLIKEAYRVRDSVFIVADLTGRAYWSNIPSSSSSRHSITEEQFVAYVQLVLAIEYTDSVWVFQWVQIVRHY